MLICSVLDDRSYAPQTVSLIGAVGKVSYTKSVVAATATASVIVVCPFKGRSNSRAGDVYSLLAAET